MACGSRHFRPLMNQHNVRTKVKKTRKISKVVAAENRQFLLSLGEGLRADSSQPRICHRNVGKGDAGTVERPEAPSALCLSPTLVFSAAQRPVTCAVGHMALSPDGSGERGPGKGQRRGWPRAGMLSVVPSGQCFVCLL